MAAAAALAVLEIVDQPALLRGVREVGAGLRDGLLEIDGVREVRGRGLMVGVGLAAGLDAHRLASLLLDAGLVVNVPEPGSLRLLPPLVIGEAEVGQALEAITGAIRRL